MVTELGSLTQEATLRGDDRAVEILRRAAEHLMAVHGDLLKLEDRKRRDRDRKPRKEPTLPRNSTESADNAESTETPAPPYVSPLTPKKQHHDAREAAAILEVNTEMVDRYTAMLSKQMGAEWPDVDAFLKRRKYSTWEAWLREMVTMVQGGSQFVPADLAQVCRDDAALDRPIGTPKGLRIFLGSARGERLNPEPPSRRPAQTTNTDDALDTWARESDAKERKHA